MKKNKGKSQKNKMDKKARRNKRKKSEASKATESRAGSENILSFPGVSRKPSRQSRKTPEGLERVLSVMESTDFSTLTVGDGPMVLQQMGGSPEELVASLFHILCDTDEANSLNALNLMQMMPVEVILQFGEEKMRDPDASDVERDMAEMLISLIQLSDEMNDEMQEAPVISEEGMKKSFSMLIESFLMQGVPKESVFFDVEENMMIAFVTGFAATQDPRALDLLNHAFDMLSPEPLEMLAEVLSDMSTSDVEPLLSVLEKCPLDEVRETARQSRKILVNRGVAIQPYPLPVQWPHQSTNRKAFTAHSHENNLVFLAGIIPWPGDRFRIVSVLIFSTVGNVVDFLVESRDTMEEVRHRMDELPQVYEMSFTEWQELDFDEFLDILIEGVMSAEELDEIDIAERDFFLKAVGVEPDSVDLIDILDPEQFQPITSLCAECGNPVEFEQQLAFTYSDDDSLGRICSKCLGKKTRCDICGDPFKYGPPDYLCQKEDESLVGMCLKCAQKAALEELRDETDPLELEHRLRFYISLARRLYGDGDIRRADQLCQAIADLFYEESEMFDLDDLWKVLCEIQAKKKEYDKAWDNAQKYWRSFRNEFRKLPREEMRFLLNLGVLAGDIDGATEWFRKVVNSDKKDYITFEQFAKNLKDSGEHEKALEIIEEGLERAKQLTSSVKQVKRLEQVRKGILKALSKKAEEEAGNLWPE